MNDIARKRPSSALSACGSYKSQRRNAAFSSVNNAATTESLFDSNEFVPVDEAAEATLARSRRATDKRITTDPTGDDDENDEKMTDIWLEQIASRFVKNGKSNKGASQKARSVADGNMHKSTQDRSAHSGMPHNGNQHDISSSNQARNSLPTLQPLSEIKTGTRFGEKVFHVDDPTRTVGEVLVESRGWIEALFGSELMKGRASQFIVAPDKYRLGERVDEEYEISNGRQDGGKSGQTGNKAGPSHFLSNQSTHGADGKKDSPSRRSSGEEISLERIFYWQCEKCKTMTSYKKMEECDSCQASRTSSSQLSALLEIAQSAANNAPSLEYAEDSIPILMRQSIPKVVLLTLLSPEARSSSMTKKLNKALTKTREMKIDEIFNWTCMHCTVINAYSKSKCKTCLKFRTTYSTASTLLTVAETAAKWARTPEQALDAVPEIHRRAIPLYFIGSIIHCVATAGRNRHCYKPKVEGSDFCETHCEVEPERKGLSYSEHDHGVLLEETEPFFDDKSIAGTEMASVWEDTVNKEKNVQAEGEKDPTKPSAHDRNVAHTIFNGIQTEVKDSFENEKDVFVHDTEDAILCGENAPYPLGSLVRRFFSWYGFHDGRITNIKRKIVTESETGLARPVLVYRVVYDDGDKEDLIHSEISSLRQLYNQRYRPSIAIPSRQIEPGSVFECRNDTIVEIVKHKTPPDAAKANEGGIVLVLLRKLGGPLRSAELKLTELQVNIVRKIGFNKGFRTSSSIMDIELAAPYGGDDGMFYFESSEDYLEAPAPAYPCSHPLLEWPTRGNKDSWDDDDDDDDDDAEAAAARPLKDEIELHPGLWLLENEARKEPEKDKEAKADSDDDLSKEEDQAKISESKKGTPQLAEEEIVCARKGLRRPDTGWDPAGAMKFIHWDPYGHISCEICQNDKDEHQILICDECHLGYHMYCVRPVIVNVPTGEWRCPRCAPSRNIETSFRGLVQELRDDSSLVVSFMGLGFSSPNAFYEAHKEGIDVILMTKSQRTAKLGNLQKAPPFLRFNNLCFSHYNQKHDWLLPHPLPTSEQYNASLLSMVAAMRYCGMSEYSENLLYKADVGVTESMNDSSLDTEEVGKMSQRNLDIFRAFKENVRAGLYPPIRLIYDIKLGFSMEAVTSIKKHTLIAEYTGEVTTVERSGETSSDSLMILLNTDDPSTSLVIDPSRAGNFARFLNGVNNANVRSLKKVNVRTRRFVFEGQCRVALFTSRDVEAGEKLCYDYNAGMMGKGAEEWAKNGFYDTSNFL